jgi:hypothetical protein
MAGRNLNPSAVGLFVLFGVAAYGGAELVSFETVATLLIADPAAERATQPIDNSMQPFVSTWSDVSGVATRARRLSLQIVLTETPDDTEAVEQALSQLAENSPTMVPAWQALAEARSARGAPIESVLAAFRMSALTGSHEGPMMMQRALFGLEHWAELPEPDRRTVIRDLRATIGQASGGDHRNRLVLARYQRILERKPAAEREAVRDALVGSGLSTQQTLRWLGV